MDQLHKNAVLCEQQIARRLAPFRIRNQDRDHVGVARHEGQRGGVEYGFELCGPFLMPLASPIRQTAGVAAARMSGGKADVTMKPGT
jgi:hypothetical protein